MKTRVSLKYFANDCSYLSNIVSQRNSVISSRNIDKAPLVNPLFKI